jgi:hypothetical protein
MDVSEAIALTVGDVSEAVREVFGKFTSDQKVLALLIALDKRDLAVQRKIGLALPE